LGKAVCDPAWLSSCILPLIHLPMRLLQHFSTACLLFFGFILLTPSQSKACVDYHNDSVYVIVHYDSTNFTDVTLTLTNLRLFGGNPNQFCSCGITSYTNVFSNILYVAFVDSGTTNPVQGFDVWDASANAANAWNNVVATGNWSGFVSMVNANGLAANAPVELLIRARLPVGATFYLMDSAIYYTQMGTDEWFDGSQTLGNTHQSVSGIDGPFDYRPEAPGSTYFSDLDAIFLTGRTAPQQRDGIDVFPVPAQDKVYVALRDPGSTLDRIEVYDAIGRIVFQQNASESRQSELNFAGLPTGMYFLQLHSDKGVLTKRIVKE
jgi:Secretion system C-terminal sorting domain